MSIPAARKRLPCASSARFSGLISAPSSSPNVTSGARCRSSRSSASRRPHSSPTFTAAGGGAGPVKSRRFASKYSSIDPCRSRWSWLRFVKTSASKRTRSSRRSAAPCELASTAALRSPASSISRKRRCRSIASGVVNGAGRRAPPTSHSTVPDETGPPTCRRRGSTRSRNAVVVFPFVPVTPASSSSFVGSPKKTSAATAIDSRVDGTSELRHVDVEHALDHDGGRATLDRLPREVVPVDALAANAEEERTRRDAPGVVREIADRDRPAPGHLARREGPDQGVKIHSQAKARENRSRGPLRPRLTTSAHGLRQRPAGISRCWRLKRAISRNAGAATSPP